MNGNWKRFALFSILLVVFAFSMALMFASGCKSKSPPPVIVEAEGKLTLDDKPLKRVQVRFVPVGDHEQEYSAYGVTDDDGKFKLSCRGKPGAAAGENVVVLEESEPPEHLRGLGRVDEKKRLELNKYYQELGSRPPAKYSNLATSTLSVLVSPDRKKPYEISLNSQQTGQ
jgi:hypothetical protein